MARVAEELTIKLDAEWVDEFMKRLDEKFQAQKEELVEEVLARLNESLAADVRKGVGKSGVMESVFGLVRRR